MSDRAQYVEDFAQLLAEGGVPKMACRVLVHLATAETEPLSLQDLASELHVSKASISTSTRTLLQLRMIRRVAVVGSRMEHYAVEPGGVRAHLVAAAENARRISQMAARGAALSSTDVSPGVAFLRDMHDAYAALGDAVDAVVADQTPTAVGR